MNAALRQKLSQKSAFVSEGELCLCAKSRDDTWMKTARRKNSKNCLLSRNGEHARDTLVLECRHLQIGAFCHAAGIPVPLDSAFSARCGSVQFGRMK
jgi:hypothetical protein